MNRHGLALCVAAFWEVFHSEISNFALVALRGANQTPTPTSKFHRLLGPFDDLWEVRGRRFRPIWGVPGVRAGITDAYV